MGTGSEQTSEYGAEQDPASGDEPLLDDPNPKHKEPWQRGARGSLCPKDADGPALLAASRVDPYIRVNVMLRTVIAHTVVSNTCLDAGTGIRSNGGRSRPLYGAAWLQTTKSANGT